MALTEKLNSVVDCFLNFDRLALANEELLAGIENNRKFNLSGKIRMLDIGSYKEGSAFVNLYGEKFPETEITYLDNSKAAIKKLKKKNKVLADATNMPFPDNYFDIAYARGLISFRSGILKDEMFTKDESYKIAKETHRVLKNKGLFVFTYDCGDDAQTLINLSEIGFKELEHLQRMLWGSGYIDTYAVVK